MKVLTFLNIAILHQLSSAKMGERRQEKKEPPIHHLERESRIVGGNQVDIGEYPFFVEWNGCGAALIHSDIILTAGHCLVIPTNEVLIGAYRSQSEEGGAEFRSIEARRRHPQYNDRSLAYDFAVMKLDEASTKNPIAVNFENSEPAVGEILTTMGFGTLSEDGWSSVTYLQEVDLNYVSHSTCNQLYGGEIEEDVMMCAAVSGGGKDSCQGDSGGPIMDRNAANGTLVGIVSWGYGCGRPEFPGVYSRTSGVTEWIQEKICELSDDPPVDCPDRADDSNGGEGDGGDITTPDGYIRTRLSIVLDGYPYENSAEIISLEDGEVLESFDDFTNSGPFSEIFLLVPGDYQLVISDSYGDGFCCEYGHGLYQIHALLPEGETVLVEGAANFTFNVSQPFTIPDLWPNITAPNPPGERPPIVRPPVVIDTCDADATNDTCVEFSFFLDGYPRETSVQVVTAETSTTIWEVNAFRQTGEFTEFMNLAPGDYVLTLRDSFGDGACCLYGDGQFDVLATTPEGNSTPLVAMNGTFTSSKQATFTVPSWKDDASPALGDDDTVEMESRITCEDQSGSIYIDDLVGNADCEWLGTNIGRYGHLCQFLEVAAHCRATCQVCDYFIKS